jgi:transposase
MKREQRKYDESFKSSALQLSEELGVSRAAKELGIPVNTLYAWRQKHERGELTADIPYKPTTALKLSDEIQSLKAELKEVKRKNAELELEKEILDKAARFFAQSQKK